MSDWSAGQPPRGRGSQRPGGYDYYAGARRPARGPTAPPPQPPPPSGRPPTSGEPPLPRKKRRWGRRIGITLLVIVALLAGGVVWADSTLRRTDALGDSSMDDTPGTNWLLVGSDSREGLSEQERSDLSAGEGIAGRRTDTMMLVHVPAGGGQPSLISFPRDSSVPIEGLGREKLNAAFSHGGSSLLAQTLENATGVHIDRYAEIGLGGFAGLVDAVGGVDICLDQPMNDWRADVQLKKGCQQLDGKQALGFARARYSLDGGDLERAENQRKLLGSLIDKATSPGTLFNPFRLVPLVSNATGTFMVANDDHVWHLARLALAMGDISSGKGVTTQVPFGGFGTSDSGDSTVEWDHEDASRMFEAIAQDKPIPSDVLDE